MMTLPIVVLMEVGMRMTLSNESSGDILRCGVGEYR